ncbi:MAG: ATP-binding cassette domain-containing protein [Clostridiales bacterium]|nr:ATP-binding cassette domain-containing protein [Clostridiales bacterium]
MQRVVLEADEGKAVILKGIDLKLSGGKVYAVTGPNGSGKSSLAKVIAGIYRPTSGRVLFDGRDITGSSITERARLGIGYAFQQPPRYKGLRVRELLELASGNTEKVNTCGLLYDVGLCARDYLEREIDASLSGGEMKRIEIATVLARKLKLALFDEPEAGIDLWSFQKLAETFRRIHDESDTTIVIITHQERILELADEIVLMTDGTVEENADRRRLLSERVVNDACRCSVNCEKGVGRDAQYAG